MRVPVCALHSFVNDSMEKKGKVFGAFVICPFNSGNVYVYEAFEIGMSAVMAWHVWQNNKQNVLKQKRDGKRRNTGTTNKINDKRRHSVR